MNCLLCGSTKQEVFTRTGSFGFPLVYYQCMNCRLIFQSPAESRAADPDFYTETYRKIYQSSDTPNVKDLWVQKQRARNIVRFVRKKKIEKSGRVLDIGASTGILLMAFKESFGCDVVGIEPGDAYRKYAEMHGLKMVPSLQALIKDNTQPFNLVTMSHVLEHLIDPVEELRKIRKFLLTDNGTLLLEVPNFYAHDSYELAHITCFTPNTLKELVKQAGYEIISLHRHGVPRSKLLNLYLTLLAKPQSKGSEISPLTPDRFVRFKRQMGFLYRRFIQRACPKKAWLPLPAESRS